MSIEAEQHVRYTAGRLAAAEKELAQEYLLLMSSGRYQTWQAQKMAEVSHGLAVRIALAEHEIALARLRRA